MSCECGHDHDETCDCGCETFVEWDGTYPATTQPNFNNMFHWVPENCESFSTTPAVTRATP